MTSAKSLYSCDLDGECHGHGYDSLGAVLTLRASPRGSAMGVEWTDTESAQGRTTYHVGEDGVLAILDETRTLTGAPLPSATWSV